MDQNQNGKAEARVQEVQVRSNKCPQAEFYEVENIGQTKICSGKPIHGVPVMPTVYGGRAICRQHRRVWTFINGHSWVEETYPDGGMIHSGWKYNG
jgi:hypothetical protein